MFALIAEDAPPPFPHAATRPARPYLGNRRKAMPRNEEEGPALAGPSSSDTTCVTSYGKIVSTQFGPKETEPV
jgi:hypothetical protein